MIDLVLATGMETMLIMAIISSAASGVMAVEGGEAAAAEAEMQMQAEKERAVQERAGRVRATRENLATTRLYQSGTGAAIESGSSAIVQADVQRQGEMATAAASRASRYKLSSLQARKKNARTAGWMEAGQSLLDAGSAYGQYKYLGGN